MPRVLGRNSGTDFSAPALPQVGSCLEDRFDLLQLVGVGGMGAVYRARDRHDGTTVAIKLLTLDEATGLRRFRREFRAASRLDHPNVVSVLSYHAGRRPFFTMEFVPGATLNTWIGPIEEGPEGGPERNRRIRSALVQILRALDYIHGQGLVHRDLKPENVLVTPDAQIKVMDFGVVRGGPASSGGLTQGRIVGTLCYMPPEQLEGREVDGRSDLYSVGAILYELLSGEPPFDERQFGSLARAILQATPASPRSLQPTADPDLSAFAMTLLKKRPWQRFASAGHALAALEQVDAPNGLRRPPLLVPQFVGREGELELVKEALDRAEERRPGLLLACGTAGIGKTRFLEEAAAIARAAGHRVLGPYGARHGRLATLEPLIEVLQAEATAEPTIQSVTDDGRQPTPPVANDLAVRATSTEPGPDDASGSDRRMAIDPHVFLTALGAVAEPPGLVLLFDDLDGFDAASLDLLLSLVRDLATPTLGEPPALLAVATVTEAALSRPGPTHHLVQLGRDLRIATLFHLRAFTADETEAATRSMLGETSVAPALAAWLHRETSGTPYVLEQTIRHLVDDEILVRDAHGLTLNWKQLGRPPRDHLDAEDFHALAHARGVNALLERQLLRLAPSARAALGVAAVIGDEFEFDVVLEAAGIAEDQLIDDLRALVAHRLVSERFERPDTYRFVHGRVRELLLADLAPEARARLHAAIAAAIERGPHGQRDPIALARHFDAAGDRERAAHYMPVAAERLAATQEHDAASEAWSRYLELDPTDSPATRAARQEFARELGLGRRLPEARAVLTALLAETTLPAERSALLNQLSRLEGRLGNFSAAITRACEQLALARITGDRLAQADALTAQGSAETNQGYFREAERSLAGAEELLIEAGAPERLSPVIRNRGCVVAQQGRLIEAAALVQQALAQSRVAADRASEQFCVLELGNIHLMRGALDRAIDCYTEALAIATELSQPHRVAYARTNLAAVLILAGDYEAAEAEIGRCLRFRDGGLNAGVETDAYLNRAAVRRAAGDLDGAMADVRRAREALGETVHAPILAQQLLELARTEASRHRMSASRRAAREALALARANRLPWLEARARCDLAAVMQGTTALSQAERASTLATEMGAELLRAEAVGQIARIATQLGDTSRARETGLDAERAVRSIARALGKRERLFLRTPLARMVLEGSVAVG